MSRIEELQREIESLEPPADFGDLVRRALATRKDVAPEEVCTDHAAPCAECEAYSLTAIRSSTDKDWGVMRDSAWLSCAKNILLTYAGVGVCAATALFGSGLSPLLYTLGMVVGGVSALVGGWRRNRDHNRVNGVKGSPVQAGFFCGGFTIVNLLAPIWFWYRPICLGLHKLGHGWQRVKAWFKRRFVDDCDECRKWRMQAGGKEQFGLKLLTGLLVNGGVMMMLTCLATGLILGMSENSVDVYSLIFSLGTLTAFIGIFIGIKCGVDCTMAMMAPWRALRHLIRSCFGLRYVFHRHLHERSAAKEIDTIAARLQSEVSDEDLRVLIRQYLSDELICATRDRLIGDDSTYARLAAATAQYIARAKMRLEQYAAFEASEDPVIREQSAQLSSSVEQFLGENEACRQVLEEYRAMVAAKFAELEAQIGNVDERMQFLAIARDTDALLADGKDHARLVREAVVSLTCELFRATAAIRAAIDAALARAKSETEVEVAAASNEVLAFAVLRNTAQHLRGSMDNAPAEAEQRPAPQAQPVAQ
ncbi:MAG: hypothetical protein ABIG71_02735 [Candidatus Uhrbacteria bacterium]